MNAINKTFLLFVFLRRAAKAGLLVFAGRILRKRSLYLLSFFFAPLITIFLVLKKQKINLATALKNLGPIFIKFGQALSTRPDLVGAGVASSLKNLQDKLEPFPGEVSKKIINNELHKNIEEIFLEFSDNPVAAASIAQVHKAKLKDGKLVAVKILRPNIAEQYKSDIKLLYILAAIGNYIFAAARRLKLKEAVKIFEKTMNFEIDLKNEAAACSELYDNLIKDVDVCVPKIYWDYCTPKILVTEWIDGVSIYDVNAIEKMGLDKEEITKKLAITFLNQTFRDGYFHADLHPGNILVLKNGKIALIDFGIMGRLSDQDRFSLAEILYSIVNKDFKRVAEIHVEIGFVPKDTNIMDFALACRAATEPIIGRPVDKISIGHLFESLFKITAQFKMQTQPQLILMQKTIVMVEGIGQILDPRVNMWSLAEPWIRNWANKNISLDAKIYRLLKKIIKEAIKVSDR